MLQYIAALVLIAHGIGHLVGFLPAWTKIDPGFKDRPWVLPGARTIDSGTGKAWSAIWIASLVLFIISGIGVFMGGTWWRQWAIIGSVVSIVAIVPWWNTVIAGAKAGVALDVAILLVLLVPGLESVADWFEVP